MKSKLVSTGLLAAMSVGTGRAAPPSIDRSVLPIPPAPYTNRVETSYRDSIPQIQPLVTAPAGAPNVLLILLDDAGYAQNSVYGGSIPTPTLAMLAAGGLRYTRFHVTALCAPSRAALLTGRNHHSVHMGNLPNFATGYEGYDGLIPRSTAFVSRILQQNGYATAAIGKWHLIPDSERSPTGPFDHWPTSEGFDYQYGFMAGATDQWRPSLYENTRPVVMRPPPGRQDDYTLNEDLADKAIEWIRLEKSVTPTRPFFVYYAPGAIHAPIQAPKAWIEKFKGKFDMGWDKYREIVLERQKKLGVVPPDTQLTPRPPELPAWDSLSEGQKKVAARLMEVVAAYMAQCDFEIGRVIEAIAETGQLNNTLIFYISGDNGASMEGGPSGTYNAVAEENGVHENTEQMLRHLDRYGLVGSSPHYPAAWAWAGNTPFQWGKQIASHLGGTRDPLVVYWPDGIRRPGGTRAQFHHLIDIAPTILEAARLPQPVRVDGVVQRPIEGTSMVYTFDNPDAPDRRTTQYFEMFANRAIYHEGWMAAARGGRLPWIFDGDADFEKQPWELYNLSADYSEAFNLAAADPKKLEEMRSLFREEAEKYHVYPLDPRYAGRFSTALRPSLNPGRTIFTYYGSHVSLYDSFAPLIRNRSFTIKAVVLVPKGGADGVIVAEGGEVGGYTLFFKNGKANFTYNFAGTETTTIAAPGKIVPGKNIVALRFSYDGGGAGKGGDASIALNGGQPAVKRIPRTMPIRFSYDETFDVGEDSGAPVGDYPAPFEFQGQIRTVTFDIAPAKLKPAAQEEVRRGERMAAEIEE